MTASIRLGTVLVTLFALGWTAAAAGEERAAPDPARILADFDRAWPASRTDYRTPGDESWKPYVTALRDLVAAGDAAVPELTKALTHTNRQVRALAARALGYLNARDAVPDLIRALRGDDWETVRLLAADSLGMIRTPEGLAALREVQARKSERKGDVLIHIAIALRRETGLEADAVGALTSIEDGQVDRAAVGAPAPDFTLETPDGRAVTLSSFAGRKPVALIFLYGDG